MFLYRGGISLAAFVALMFSSTRVQQRGEP